MGVSSVASSTASTPTASAHSLQPSLSWVDQAFEIVSVLGNSASETIPTAFVAYAEALLRCLAEIAEFGDLAAEFQTLLKSGKVGVCIVKSSVVLLIPSTLVSFCPQPLRSSTPTIAPG